MDYSNQLQADQKQQVQLCYQLKSDQAFDHVIVQQRRSANYKPNIWKYDFLQSLCSKYDGEEYKRKVEKLRENVKAMFVETVEELATLELIDMIRKLGLSDHFADETQKALQSVAKNMKNNEEEPEPEEEDLYITALRFRLLRLHGLEVSQDVFNGFLDEKGAFSASKCSADIKGLLELFETSYLAFEGENILDKAKAFSTETLRRISSTLMDANLAKQVTHALELSTHWRVQWFDVKWHITVYENSNKVDKRLLELAKLNFNTLQATLQKDLSGISRWWRNLGLIEHLDFTRDRLAESFLCAVGLAYEPEYSCFRTCLTKITTMILIIDDVYDIYGSLEELEQFTDAVDRWDSSKIQQLSECMKKCFQALYDITNEIAHDIQKLNGWHVQSLLHLRKAWAGFCKALFVEAKWYNEGYTPSLEEYLSNALISSGGIVISVHSMLSMAHDFAEEMVDFLGKNHDLVCNISIITRLCNDLGTSVAEKERGDAPSSILCYMREMEVSEEKAQKHIKEMITNTWKKINGQCFNSDHQLPNLLQSFVKVTVNVARMVHCLYQFGDGFGIQDNDTRRHILSLLIEPVKLDSLNFT